MIASSLDDAIEPRCHHDMIALTAADYLKSAVVRGVEVVIIIVIRGSVFRYHSCHSRFSLPLSFFSFAVQFSPSSHLSKHRTDDYDQ